MAGELAAVAVVAVGVSTTVDTHARQLIGSRLLQGTTQQQALRVEGTLLRHPSQSPVGMPRRQATLQGGRFLFRGGTQEQIEDAVRQATAQYRLTTEPVP